MDEALRINHGISDQAFDAAVNGRWDEFVAARLAALQADENKFVADIIARHPEVGGGNVAGGSVAGQIPF